MTEQERFELHIHRWMIRGLVVYALISSITILIMAWHGVLTK